LLYSFRSYALDTETRELRCDAELIAVEPQVFDLLVFLIENRDRVVGKDELIAAIWRGRIVSESTLTSRINAARKAIGDSGERQSLIRTVARRGLRFVGTLHEPAATSPDAMPAPLGRPLFPLPNRPAIAVLPFSNMSNDHDQEYFSDGISEDLITALSKLRWFLVIARNSSFVYKDKAVNLKQVADELGVHYVIEGSVRKSGGRVRITAQLIDAVTGSHLWADRYDRDLADIFAVQDEITEAIVAAIEPQLYTAENFRAQRKPPDSLDAWDLVMRALSHYWRITPQDNVAAQALLEKAISIDPNYSQALGVLANSYIFGAHMGWSDMTAAAAAAEKAALTAIRYDSEDPWAHMALGHVYMVTRRFDDSLAEYELTLRLNPNFAQAQADYALLLSYNGRGQEAKDAVQRAIRLSPRDPFLATYYGIAAYAEFVGRNYEEAIKLARDSLRQRRDFVGAHRVLTAAAGMTGDQVLAREALMELRRVQSNVSLAWIAANMPIRHDPERQHYLEGFRRAGLD
jgi:TolB-like protein/cytochrome c-type biogenesis protein CcmH/NrfG